jgi:hypothetical protein
LRSPYRHDGRPQDWRRQALRPFPAVRGFRGAARRIRSLLSQSTRSVWAYRPMAPRSRHGPAPASPARSFGRAPFARAGREAGRRRSTANLATPQLRQGLTRQERRPQRRTTRLPVYASRHPPGAPASNAAERLTLPRQWRCIRSQLKRPDRASNQAERRKNVTQGAKKRSSPRASRRSRDNGDRADTGVPAASPLIFGSRRCRSSQPRWR